MEAYHPSHIGDLFGTNKRSDQGKITILFKNRFILPFYNLSWIVGVELSETSDCD